MSKNLTVTNCHSAYFKWTVVAQGSELYHINTLGRRLFFFENEFAGLWLRVDGTEQLTPGHLSLSDVVCRRLPLKGNSKLKCKLVDHQILEINLSIGIPPQNDNTCCLMVDMSPITNHQSPITNNQ
jgi:hypothetical protein